MEGKKHKIICCRKKYIERHYNVNIIKTECHVMINQHYLKHNNCGMHES